jgi:hypothetical protein
MLFISHVLNLSLRDRDVQVASHEALQYDYTRYLINKVAPILFECMPVATVYMTKAEADFTGAIPMLNFRVDKRSDQ